MIFLPFRSQVYITPYLGAIDSLLELGAMTPYFAAIISLLELIVTPYLGAIIVPLDIGTPYLGAIISLLELLAFELELATFGVFSEELVASSAEELDSCPPVAELEEGFSMEELDGESSDAEDGSLSQLAQKKPVRASKIFVQCLYNILGPSGNAVYG